MFTVFLSDLPFAVNDIDIESYADKNTPSMFTKKVDDLITYLEETSYALSEWFKNYLLKSKADKCHLHVSTNESVSINVAGIK